ncbi:hypothetical protein MM213_13220 [Belliella sp. R4-6]|uniref:HipA-like kinase domain-containing protein n=1 Tax=Belliella alkalica TaxID=1730871 RepID=A0ABS9VDD9_9BACT|nr:HipA family kinase [Belliella alkalica]MCH7414453.1 hypothetical protein [Belliella alkalica]
MIPIVKTITFIEELIHQNSAPVKFLCDDFNTYYCKSTLNDSGHDFLVYEIIGNRLANYFEIASPEIAFVQFNTEAMGSYFFQRNFNVENEDILFGSKYIGINDHLDKTGKFTIKNSKEFSKLSNPADLLKIAIMDIHLNNSDRNEENFNLLFQTKKRSYYAIDHAAIFGGPAMKGRFTPRGEPSLGQKLLSSYLLKNVLKFISFEKVEEIVENYFSKCNDALVQEVREVFDSLPNTWEIDLGLEDRILEYVLNNTRLNLLELLIKDRIYEIKKKK